MTTGRAYYAYTDFSAPTAVYALCIGNQSSTLKL
jgi:hypothetical protein